MDQFVGREQEMAFLEREYRRDGSSLVILYGRRRVGKTTLASQFINGKRALYFLVTEESEGQNRKAFQASVANFTGQDLIRNARLDSWEPLFQILLKEWKGFKKEEEERKEKLVLVLDEFQYLGRSNPAFPSIFQKIWDTVLKDEAVMVILCGSLVSMMESQTLNYSSPLYGRRTGQIKLRQLSLPVYKGFFPEKEVKELIPYYAVTGGVPKYIELFREEEDIYEAIDRNILSRQSFLYDEPNFLLQGEVMEIGSYFSVIRAIAAGNHKLSKIAGSLELKQTGLTKYLKTLMDLDIIEREVPVTVMNPEKSKKGLYRFRDNFLLFWFRFIYPNRGLIESGHRELVMDKIRSNLVDGHIVYVYENICREQVWNLSGSELLGFTFDKVGRWWDSRNEIDIVAIDSSGMDILFGECKYWESKVGMNILRQLEDKARVVEWKKDSRRDHFILYSKSGFTEELQEYAATRKDVILQPTL